MSNGGDVVAANDYHVLVYGILSYLYACLKAGERVDMQKISREALDIPLSYWEYIMYYIQEDGLVSRDLALEDGKPISVLAITPTGIEYLAQNSMMTKAKEAAKELAKVVPGIAHIIG